MDKIYSQDDDNELWRLATSEFKPLKNKKPIRLAKTAQKNNFVKQKLPVTNDYIAHAPVFPQQAEHKFIQIGDVSQVDGSIAKKLKEGSYPIDVTLDLHGRNQDDAFAALHYFINTAYGMGKRCILVITGKGEQGRGILREQLPKWLSTPGIQEYILALHAAKANHGGSGAFYVLLRKNKML